MQTTSSTDIVLATSMQATPDELTISYAVTNHGTNDLYLFNLMHRGHDASTGLRVDVNLAAIEFRADVVVISKKLVPVPHDIDVEVPDLPCVTLVEPGTQATQTFRVKLPLQPWTPYEQGAGTRPGTRAALFELGYFFGRPATRARAQPVATKFGPAFYFESFPESSQLLIDVGPFETVPTLED